jgi:hypothetical protein
MEINIVADSPCPECGAYWGNPNKSLDFPNRVKVDDLWKCYNPGCDVAYYRDSLVVERRPSQEIREEIETWADSITFGSPTYGPQSEGD